MRAAARRVPKVLLVRRRGGARVADGETLSFVGIAGNLQVAGFWFALVKRFQAEGHPKNLTVVCHGGNGGRGKLPGSLDDVLKLKGCVTRFITAHCDTHIFAKKRMLDPADRLEIQQLPLGTMSLIYKSMAAGGPPSHTSTTGVDTVFDPRVGRGSFVTPGLTSGQLIRAEVDGRLTYSLPLFNACMLNCAAADPDGNVYCRGQSMISDAKEQALAVKRNGGTVYVTVGLLVPKRVRRRPPPTVPPPRASIPPPLTLPQLPRVRPPAAQLAPRPHLSHAHHLPYRYSDVFLSSDQVDVIVLDPGAEQCIGGTYVAPWPFLTLDDQGEWAADDGERVVRFINNTLKLTPVRYPKDALLGRLGASIVATTAAIGARVNIGTGLPEEVSIALKNVSDLIEPFNEGGALGGVSAPGTFFGAAICPKEIVSSAEVYTRVYQRLDVVVVGGLEVDESGNVNVACRADPLGYVGVGGFVDLTCAAKICVFAVAFATGSKIEVDEAARCASTTRENASSCARCARCTSRVRRRSRRASRCFM